MSFAHLCLVLAVFFLPAQDRLFLGAGANAVLDPASQSGEPHFGPNVQPANDDGVGPMGSRGQSDLIFEGVGKLHLELTLDGFGIRDLWAQANTSFSIVYQFEIGKDSHPMHIFLLAGEKYIDAKAAEAGLAKWTFAGLEAGKKYVMVLNWQHARGYVSMSILSDQMTFAVRMQRDRIFP